MSKRAHSFTCTEDEFVAAIGRTIVAYQHLEVTTSALFANLLGARNEVGARGAFYQIVNYSTRIQMMDVAARFLHLAEPEGKLHKRWEAISSRLWAASNLRNRIAHGELGEVSNEYGSTFILRQPIMDFSRLDPKDIEKSAKRNATRLVDYNELQRAEHDWDALCSDVHQLSVDLRVF